MPIPKKISDDSYMNAKTKVYSTLKDWIIDGTLEPGERLNDANLAKYFDVSRTPVREAIQLLNEQHLVKIIPSSGTFVENIDMDALKKIYDLLGGLQAMALEFCIGHVTEEQFDELDRLNDNFFKCLQAGVASATVDADYRFHIYLSSLSGNKYLVDFSNELLIHARRNEIKFFQYYKDLEKSYQSHKDIIEALRKGDLKTAKKVVTANWRVSYE